MKIGPLSVEVVPVESKARLINGKYLAVAQFTIEGLGPERNVKFTVDQPVPSIHAPMFREDGSRRSLVFICKQDDPRLTWFLLVHEILHAFCWLLHLPPRSHYWVDKLVRHQALDAPCPAK